MKPSRLIAGLTTSTILVGSLTLAPHALAEPTTPTPEPTQVPASPYSYAAIGDSATVGGSWFAPLGDLCGRTCPPRRIRGCRISPREIGRASCRERVCLYV